MFEYNPKLMEAVCERLHRDGLIHYATIGPGDSYTIDWTQLGRDKILSIGGLVVPFAPTAFGAVVLKAEAQPADCAAFLEKALSLRAELEPPTWSDPEWAHFIMLVLTTTKDAQPSRN